ncbi:MULTISPECIES: FHA domain-containing protein [Rhodomicrobium]|uniref:FHA domain-containing protein n=1 Tax=Rhodomicrobium TaxID=1068 RepID=UPI001483C56E|nr:MULTISPECIES: FHA domain-containing protein [Rhodomicrobium]
MFSTPLLTRAASAQTEDVDLVPRCSIDPAARMVNCDIRLNTKVPDNFLIKEEKSFSEVKITWPDEQSQDLSLSRFAEDGEKAAWLIMIDQSRSLSTQTIEAIKRDFGKVILRKGDNDLIGIGTFDRSYKSLAPVGSSQGVLEQKLSEITPVGKETYLYESVGTAIDSLRSVRADRKALVIVTDGLAEDPDPEGARFNVINKAIDPDNNVVIYTVTYAQGQIDGSVFDKMKQLAERTGGPSRQANLKQGSVLSDAYADRFYEFLKNGGSISFPLRTLEKDETVKFSISTTFEGAGGLANMERPVQLPYYGPPVPEGFFRNIVASFERVFGKTGGLFVLVALILVVLALIALAVYVAFFRPRHQLVLAAHDLPQSGTIGGSIGIDIPGADYGRGGEAADMPTSIVAPRGGGGGSGEVYGWLEVVGSGDRIPLKQTGLRIGRHEDNDIRFDATTVHRRHAVVHMTPQRDFVITDLSGSNGNGVQINSVRVERAELKDGDVVQLGEVRVKFHAATI